MNSKNFKIGVSALAILALAGGEYSLAHAQESEDDPVANNRRVLNPVVVEARRIEENVQDTPVSIGVLDRDFLLKQKVESIEEVLTLSPGATFLTFSKAQPEKSLRGFVAPSTGNASAEQSIVTVVDGFALTKDAIKSPPVFDLERVEVLRGPQGTTFGRNASIGLIHLVTAKPTYDFQSGINFTAGSDELFEVDGFVSGPIIGDTLAGRLAFNFDSEDGATSSTSTGEGLDGESNFAIRGSLLWEPTSRFTANLKVEYSEDNDEGAVRRGVDSTVPFIDGPRVSDFAFVGAFVNHPAFGTTFFDSDDVFQTEISDDRDFFLDRQIWTATAELSYQLTDDLTVTSITGYQDGEGQGLADVLGSPENIVFQQVINDASVFSQEVRIDNHASGNRLRWLGGVYYLHDEETRFQQNQFFQTDLDTGLDPLAFPQIPTFLTDIGENETDSIAVFGEVLFDVTEKLELAVGGRWSRDEKEGTLSALASGFRPVLGGIQDCPNPGPIVCGTVDNPVGFSDVEVSEDFSDFTGKVSLNYEINDDHSVYFLWSQGFKSGGFQNSARSEAAALIPFDAESTNNYEIGWKGEINSQARFSLTGFFQRATDVQTVTLVPIDAGFGSVTSNLGAVRSFGLEGDLTYLVTENFRLGGSFSAIDSELQDTLILTGVVAGTEVFTDLSGQRPEVAPRWTGTFYAEYDYEFANGSILSFRGDFIGRDTVFDGNEDRATTVRIRPTTTNLGARISYDFGSDLQYRILLWGKNLNEDFDIDNIGPFQPNTLQLPVGFSGKRTFGITLSARFN